MTGFCVQSGGDAVTGFGDQSRRGAVNGSAGYSSGYSSGDVVTSFDVQSGGES
jgi:hypothetical protein